MLFRSILLISVLSFSMQKHFHFNQNHSFTILQITDLHYGESETADAGNQKNVRFFIENIKPDVVVVTGDLVSGYAWDMEDPTFYQSHWANFSQVFNETQTYYAYALGNHDHQGNFNREQIAKLDMTSPYSLMNASKELDWASTYNVPIFSSYNKSALATNLWLFDSGDQYMLDLSWGKITADQMTWFKSKAHELREQYREIPHSMAFFHIPLPEFMDVWNDQPVFGEKYEDVCCPLFDHGTVFDQFVQEGVSGVFCGHDHNNYYGGWNRGIELVYGRKSGYGSYGPPENVTRGARVITLKEKFDLKTNKIIIERDHYIFDENGEVILNGPSFIRSYQQQNMCSPSFDFSKLLPILDFLEPIIIVGLIYLIWRLLRGIL